MSFVVQLSLTAEADLERLFEFLLDRAETTEDLDCAQAAIDAIRATAQHRLAITPFSFRKAAQNPAQRELIIPFGGTGYVALYGDRQYFGSPRAGGAPPACRGLSLTPFSRMAGRPPRASHAPPVSAARRCRWPP